MSNPVPPKPLSPLETRCYAALLAFQEQHARLPSQRELTEAARFSGGSQTGDVLHRLVCKGWIETDKLPAPEPKVTQAKVKQPEPPAPKEPTFVPKSTNETVSAALIRAIRVELDGGTKWRHFHDASGVQWNQLRRLLERGTSLRTEGLDGLSLYLRLQLVPVRGDKNPYDGLNPTDALRKAIADERAAGATLVEICRAAKVNASNIGEFVNGRCSLNLATVDVLCGALGLELKPTTPPAAADVSPAERVDHAPPDTSRSPRNA